MEKETAKPSSLAKALAPEDVRRGDYVTLLHVVWEIPSFFWCNDGWRLPFEEPVRLRLMAQEAGVPLKVKSVCLPFVLAQHPHGDERTIDLRRYRIARLSRDFAKTTWKALRKQKPKPTGLSCGL